MERARDGRLWFSVGLIEPSWARAVTLEPTRSWVVEVTEALPPAFIVQRLGSLTVDAAARPTPGLADELTPGAAHQWRSPPMAQSAHGAGRTKRTCRRRLLAGPASPIGRRISLAPARSRLLPAHMPQRRPS
jgi:hypothetical protein